MKPRKTKFVALAIVAAALAATVLYVSNHPLFLARGSDVVTTTLAPTQIAQYFGLGLLVASIGWLLFPVGRHWRAMRIAVMVVAACSFALACHRVVIDGKTGEIRDTWLLVTVQSLNYSLSDDPDLALERREYKLSQIVETADGDNIRLFTGIGPLGLETGSLDRFWPISVD